MRRFQSFIALTLAVTIILILRTGVSRKLVCKSFKYGYANFSGFRNSVGVKRTTRVPLKFSCGQSRGMQLLYFDVENTPCLMP